MARNADHCPPLSPVPPDLKVSKSTCNVNVTWQILYMALSVVRRNIDSLYYILAAELQWKLCNKWEMIWVWTCLSSSLFSTSTQLDNHYMKRVWMSARRFWKVGEMIGHPPTHATHPTHPNLGSERCGRRADKHSNTGSLCSPEGPSYHHFLLPVVLSLVLSTEYAVHVHHSYDNPCHVTRRLSCGSLDEFFNSVTGIGALFDSFLPWMYLLLENDCTMWIVRQKESITHATCYLKYNNLV